MTHFGEKYHSLFHIFTLSLKRRGYFYKKIRTFLLKLGKELMDDQISKIEFLKALLINHPKLKSCYK